MKILNPDPADKTLLGILTLRNKIVTFPHHGRRRQGTNQINFKPCFYQLKGK